MRSTLCRGLAVSCLAVPTVLGAAIGPSLANEPVASGPLPSSGATTALVPWESPGATWLAAQGLGTPPMALSPEAMGLSPDAMGLSPEAMRLAPGAMGLAPGAIGYPAPGRPDVTGVVSASDALAVARPVSDQHGVVARAELAGFHLDVDERPTTSSAVAVRLADGDEPATDETDPDGAEDADATADEPEGVDAQADGPEPVFETADGEAIDAERVRDFLEGRGAPLADEAETIVAAGVEHGVDPRVVVGIAVAESSGGEELPPGGHNAWGWGGSGAHGLAEWGSWDEAIDTFTARLGANYDTDDVDASFARTYCPPNWRWWLETVTWVVDEI